MMAKKPRKKGKMKYNAGEMGPRSVDVYVGRRVRDRSTLMVMSQEKLAEVVGLSFQQIQKYETGSNRVSASRLYEFSTILSVSPSWFFEGYKEGYKEKDAVQDEPDICKRETLEFIRSYEKIPEMTQKQLRALIMATSKEYGK